MNHHTTSTREVYCIDNAVCCIHINKTPWKGWISFWIIYKRILYHAASAFLFLSGKAFPRYVNLMTYVLVHARVLLFFHCYHARGENRGCSPPPLLSVLRGRKWLKTCDFMIFFCTQHCWCWYLIFVLKICLSGMISQLSLASYVIRDDTLTRQFLTFYELFACLSIGNAE